jgi:hypothetical protein
LADVLIPVLFVVVWLVLMRWVLSRAGVPT